MESKIKRLSLKLTGIFSGLLNICILIYVIALILIQASQFNTLYVSDVMIIALATVVTLFNAILEFKLCRYSKLEDNEVNHKKIKKAGRLLIFTNIYLLGIPGILTLCSVSKVNNTTSIHNKSNGVLKAAGIIAIVLGILDVIVMILCLTGVNIFFMFILFDIIAELFGSSLFQNIFYSYSQTIFLIPLLLALINIILGISLIKKAKLNTKLGLVDKLVSIAIIAILLMISQPFPISTILIGIALIVWMFEKDKPQGKKPEVDEMVLKEEKLTKLKSMYSAGIITQEEYKAMTQKVIVAKAEEVSEEDYTLQTKIAEVKKLKAAGIINDEEYKRMIQKLL